MMEPESEFPETRSSKIAKKIGWLFSPVLFISLVAVTIIFAKGLRIDLEKGTIEKKSTIDIKELKLGKVFIDGKEAGETPDIFNITETDTVNVKITKEDRVDWNKQVNIKPEIVSSLLPVMFPKKMEFNDERILAHKVYTVDGAEFVFYEKIEERQVLIYQYSVLKQILGVRVDNRLFADITSLVIQSQTADDVVLKDFQIIPSNEGESFILVIPGEKAYIVERSRVTPLFAEGTPKLNDSYTWSPNDSYIIYKTNGEIYSINESTKTKSLIFKPQTAEQKADVEFLFDTGLVYKVQDGNVLDLVQNSYQGNNLQRIEIPNIDNMRKNNLVKAYDLLEKDNLILIQTKDNIFSYNVASYELKKFNRFKGEEVIYVDPIREKVLTINNTNLNQFRYYDIDQSDSKTFIIGETTQTEKPKKVVGYNLSNNLVLNYQSKIEFIDIDGANRLSPNLFQSPEISMAIKLDNVVSFMVKDIATEESTDPQTTPTPTGTPRKPLTKFDKYVLRLESFEN